MKTKEQAAKEIADGFTQNFAANSLQSENNAYVAGIEVGVLLGVNLAEQWIDVNDELPESLKQVLVKCMSDYGKSYVTMAKFVKGKTVLSEDFLDPDCCDSCQEYDESIDDYYVIEGWFEYQTEVDINWKISSNVTHWRPINRG